MKAGLITQAQPVDAAVLRLRRRWPSLIGILLLGLLGGLGSRALAATTLVPFNSNWYYFSDGYEPVGWKEAGYDDGDWGYSGAQFGYGDGDEATILYYGPDDEHKFITYYFRYYVYVSNPDQYESVTFSLIRDDGAVVYVNGIEAFRDNLPEGEIGYDTYALTGVTYPAENTPVDVTLSSSVFTEGLNVIAVEMHQYEPASPDLSFDLQVVGNAPVVSSVARGPYLQVGTSSNIVVRWRTTDPTTTRVRYGTSPGNLTQSAASDAFVTDHEITLPGLQPDTKYFYEIGTATAALAGDASYYFITAPRPGTPKPTRVWAIGDFGTGFFTQGQVRDAYANFTGSRPTDVWLLLGDNAYYTGSDAEYQAYCFDVYPTMFRQTVAWPTMGNHETGGGTSTYSDAYAYYDIFTMPKTGQAGGVPSGSEHYYSFDYANIHFVCLDSMTAILRQPNSAMLQWLQADLADTSRDWIIVYFHHPPYTKGSHNSDAEVELIEMRANVNPILEAYGVDLVLSGHSHSYERSYLLDGFYGYSPSVSAANFIDHGNGRTNGTGAYLKAGGGLGAHRGLVYIVDGSSGGQGGGGNLNHPAMFYSTLTVGSLVLDITGQRLDAKFISGNGTIDDTFTILKDGYPGAPRPSMNVARSGNNAVITWPTTVPDYQLEAKVAVDGPTWTPVNGTISTNGRQKSVTVPASTGKNFFHLRNIP